MSDGSGSTALRYDRHGRLLAKTQTVGSGTPRTLATTYLPNARVEGYVLPSGAVVRYLYRADGRVLSITVNGVEVVRAVDYFAFGEVRGWDYGATGEYRRTYDNDGRIREHTAGAGVRELDFDPASRIIGLADSAAAGAANDWSFDYDDLDRLTDAQNASTVGAIANLDLTWAYDGTGNRTSETRNADPPIPYAIDPGSNQLQQVGSKPRQYDAVGNTLDDGAGTVSRYNARNRLTQVTRAGLSIAYAHNAFGERVCKAIDWTGPCAEAPDRIEYVYDTDGRLIGKYPVGGSPAQAVEYLWLDDTPIAVLQRRPGSADGGPTGGGSETPWNGTPAGGIDLYHLHPDHLDTPRVVLNANNQPIWRWDSAPFGDTLANEQPSGGLPSYTFNLRFPGQQYDAETGTHYNYFRDYEPGSGRYVQSDPLLGGILRLQAVEEGEFDHVPLDGIYSQYAYVLLSPNDSVDDLGLKKKAKNKKRRGGSYSPPPGKANVSKWYKSRKCACDAARKKGRGVQEHKGSDAFGKCGHFHDKDGHDKDKPHKPNVHYRWGKKRK